MKDALIVVGKRPMPGQTKTRLCPPLTPQQAARLYRCLLVDTLSQATRLGSVDRALAYTPSDARAYFRELVPNGFRLLPQQGADLGERLANALAHHLDGGYRRAVIMNSDGPTLPIGYLEEAFSRLDGADVTLGPGHDGGYYLIGMSRPHPELFEGIPWSTEKVVLQTLAAAWRLGLKVHLLPEWYDVDVGADLVRLRRELGQRPDAAPRTAALLRGLKLREG